MPLEPIHRQRFDDPGRMRGQDEAIASVRNNIEQHLAAYKADPRSFDIRYVAADPFKETFLAYAASKDSRNSLNTPVHRPPPSCRRSSFGGCSNNQMSRHETPASF